MWAGETGERCMDDKRSHLASGPRVHLMSAKAGKLVADANACWEMLVCKSERSW